LRRSSDFRLLSRYHASYQLAVNHHTTEEKKMAKYDQGGGCACGLQRECDCTPTAVAPANDNKPHNHAAAINLFAADCHAASRRAGWYTDLATGKALDRNVPEMLCLIHSEISEAMEGYRKSKPGKVLMDDKLPHRPMAEVELADAMIRIGDLASFLGYDLGGAIVEKMAFNANRPDHKIENRLKAGGKAF